MRQFHFDFYCFFDFLDRSFFLNGFPNPFIVRSRSNFLFSQWKFFELYVRTFPAMFFLISVPHLIFEVKSEKWFWSRRNRKWSEKASGFVGWHFFCFYFKVELENGFWTKIHFLARNCFADSLIVRPSSSCLSSQWKFAELYFKTCPAMFYFLITYIGVNFDARNETPQKLLNSLDAEQNWRVEWKEGSFLQAGVFERSKNLGGEKWAKSFLNVRLFKTVFLKFFSA